MRPRILQPLFIRTAEFMGVTQIDIRRIETFSRYERLLWKPVEEKQYDVKVSAFGPGTSSERYRTEMARTLDEDYGKHVEIYTDGSKMGDKVGYAIVKEEHKIKKRILPQNTVQCKEVCNYWSNTIGEKQQTQNSDNTRLPKHDNGS
jgi:hypothetical protein